jgi:hypothetical protein
MTLTELSNGLEGGVGPAPALPALPALPAIELDAYGDRLARHFCEYLERRIARNTSAYDTSRLFEALGLISKLRNLTFGNLTDDQRSKRFWQRVPAASDRVWGVLASEDSLGLDAPCWEWQGAKRSSDGIGVVSWHTKLVHAHRKAYELFFGRELVLGERLLRLCATPHCVNIRDHYSCARPRPPQLLDSARFRAKLADAYDQENYCNQGHTLKPYQRKSDCGECHRERKIARRVERDRLAKESAEAYLSPRAAEYRSVTNSLSAPDLSGLMEH